MTPGTVTKTWVFLLFMYVPNCCLKRRLQYQVGDVNGDNSWWIQRIRKKRKESNCEKG